MNNRDPSGTDLLVCRPRWGKADYTYFEGGASVTVGYDVIVGYDCAWQQSGGSDGGDGPTVGPGRGIRSPGGRITARRVLGAHLKRVGDVLGECGSARSGAAATIVGDLSFFSGTGVLIKAGKLGQGFRATSAALRNWTPTAPWLAAQLESQSSAAAASFAASRTALGASGAELGNRVQQSAMSAPGQSFKEWIKSIVPGFASATAVAAARNACQ